MKYIRITAVIVSVLLAAAGCRSEFDMLMDSGDANAKFKAAMNYFQEGKYTKAAELFESLSVISSGTERDDTVQYYWGLSNYSNKDYYTAQTNFEHFIERFPRSPFAESAQFLNIDCLYKSTLRYELDQTPTYNAITKISEYLIDHPSGANADICNKMLSNLNDRLDRKAFENARLYYKMVDYKASRVAFKNILKDDADNI